VFYIAVTSAAPLTPQLVNHPPAFEIAARTPGTQLSPQPLPLSLSPSFSYHSTPLLPLTLLRCLSLSHPLTCGFSNALAIAVFTALSASRAGAQCAVRRRGPARRPPRPAGRRPPAVPRCLRGWRQTGALSIYIGPSVSPYLSPYLGPSPAVPRCLRGWRQTGPCRGPHPGHYRISLCVCCDFRRERGTWTSVRRGDAATPSSTLRCVLDTPLVAIRRGL